MREKKHGSGPYMKATAVSVEQAVMSPGGSQVIADELNRLLRDVRVLQAAGIELANATVGMAWRMEVNELIGKTDILGVSDQKAYDAAKAAHAKFVEVSGALTRWGER